MHNDWHAFLESQGAHFSDDGSVRFDGAATDTACALTDLSQLGIIAVSGPDTIDFLQGQVSNDLREVSETHSQLNSHCSAKGRMLANFRVLRMGDRLLLLLPRTQLEPLLKRLRMFLLRANATVDDVSDTLACIGLTGACAEQPLAQTFGDLPGVSNGMTRTEDSALVRVEGPEPRYLLIGSVDSARTAWEAARAAGAKPSNQDLWTLHDVRAGIPTVLPETSERFVPQMANMQLIDGVSFHKGCYTGQEIVARMQYLGKLKRRMYVARATLAADSAAPVPGTVLSAPGSSSEQASGWVVNAVATGHGHYEMLVVAEIAAAESGELRLGEDGPALEVSAPPYGFAADAA